MLLQSLGHFSLLAPILACGFCSWCERRSMYLLLFVEQPVRWLSSSFCVFFFNKEIGLLRSTPWAISISQDTKTSVIDYSGLHVAQCCMYWDLFGSIFCSNIWGFKCFRLMSLSLSGCCERERADTVNVSVGLLGLSVCFFSCDFRAQDSVTLAVSRGSEFRNSVPALFSCCHLPYGCSCRMKLPQKSSVVWSGASSKLCNTNQHQIAEQTEGGPGAVSVVLQFYASLLYFWKCLVPQ